MQFVSTRGGPEVTLSDALAAGLAPDGGLYVPRVLPVRSLRDFDGAHGLVEVSVRLLAPFFADDRLAGELTAILTEAFSFEAPLTATRHASLQVLELFHGPTSAFKDFGARFLAAALQRLASRELTVLVATSGDTGSAVASAFHGRAGFRVAVLYPDGLVSPRQAHQLGAFGDNVRAFRVAGTFDDCQRMVKAAFVDAALGREVALTSANSISLGRLLPQMAYYAHASLQHWRAHGRPLSLIIPTGNLGNALAAVWCRASGLPIGAITLATNANRVLLDYFAGGDYHARPSVSTLANAMDVGAPSNFERLRWFCSDESKLRGELDVIAVDDDTIRETLVLADREQGHVLCPHTATAYAAWRAKQPAADTAIVATAHPAKFETVVEPVLGRAIDVPTLLAEILARPAHAEPLAADEATLAGTLRAW